LRAEGFSCSLGVLYGGQGIRKLQFLNKKIIFSAVKFFQFWSSKTLDPDPDPQLEEKKLDLDPKPCVLLGQTSNKIC
jgi:hypothetical protein